MSHILPITQVDSLGNDATDTDLHAVRVNVVAGGGGGGGGGAVTIADGADVAEGSKADSPWSGSGDGTVISLLKAIAGTSGGGVAPITLTHTFGPGPDAAALTTDGMTTFAGYNTAQTGGFSDNLFVQVSNDGTNWDSVPVFINNSGQVWWFPSGSVTNWTPYFRANVAGFKFARLNRSGGSTGTSTWILVATPAAIPGHTVITIGAPDGRQAQVDSAGNLRVFIGNPAVSIVGGDQDGQAPQQYSMGIGGVYNDGLTALPSGRFAEARFTPNRGMHVNLRDQDGFEPNSLQTIADAGTWTTTLNGQLQTNRTASSAYITIQLGAVSGGTPKLSAQVQWSPDDGVTFLNLGDPLPDLTTTNQTGVFLVVPQPVTPPTVPINFGASVQQYLSAPMPRIWRLVYTITGSGPSFAITRVSVNYVP